MRPRPRRQIALGISVFTGNFRNAAGADPGALQRGLDLSFGNQLYRPQMNSSPLARFGLLAAFLSITAVASFALSPPAALAHHHATKSGQGKNGENPAQGALESDCSLCLSISLNDGNALDGNPSPAPEIFGSSQAQGPPRVAPPLGESSRSLPIRGPPVNA